MKDPAVETVPKLCVVATLDILGVKSVMARMGGGKLARISKNIAEAFDRAKNTARKVLHSQFDTTRNTESVDEFCDKIQAHNFSDTIVFTCPISEGEYLVALFCLTVSLATYKMFEAGLPIRGCIDYGVICSRGGLVFGKPFLRSLLCGESLDFSGLILTEDAYDFLSTYEKAMIFLPLQELGLPVKDEHGRGLVYKNLLCVNWLKVAHDFLTHTDLFPTPSVVHSVVVEKFEANEKSIDDGVRRKIANTENTIRAFMLQNSNTEKRDK